MRACAAADGENGEATVEFVALLVVLVVPLLYFVLTVAQIQASVFAAESAAAAAARIVARHPDSTDLSRQQVSMVFQDFSLPAPDSVEIGCVVCSGPNQDIQVTVRTSVPWPLLPSWAQKSPIPVVARVQTAIEGVSIQ